MTLVKTDLGFLRIIQRFKIVGRETNNNKVIQRIITTKGVYIDDLSDWGKNLGKTRHSSADQAIQIQEEVLMNPGSFKQTAEPIPIKNSKGELIQIGGYDAYYLDLIEL